jgi:uncharacterized damage-inducible protein DinB
MSTADPAAPSIRQLVLGDLDQEFSGTRAVLERVPDEHFAWKPHEKSFTMGALASHVATLPFLLQFILDGDVFDVLAPFPMPAPLESREAVLAAFAERSAALRERLDAADDALLSRPWELRAGAQVNFRAPKHAVLRTLGLNHIIHHRAQLTVYLRLLDVPLPPLYGPTADERMPF